MMRSAAYALFFSLAGASAAQAGAWLREAGTGFLSSSVGTNIEEDISTSLYAEYGLTPRLTLGADVYYGSDLITYQDGSGIVFLRFPLGPTDRTHKWAAHLGAGARYTALEFTPALEAGLSWGRGIEWRDRYGWLNVDAVFNTAGAPAQDRVKLDATAGMALTDRSKVMLQMFNTFEDGETYTRLAPSYLFTPTGSKTTYQISVEAPVAGGGDTTFKIGIWLSF